MNRRLLRLSIVFLCMLFGWTLGYIRIPYIERNDLFWVGFACGLSLQTFIFTVFHIWQNKELHTQFKLTDGVKGFILKNGSLFIASLLTFVCTGLCLCLMYMQINQQKLNSQLHRLQSDLLNLQGQNIQEQQKSKMQMLLELIHELDSNQLSSKDTANTHKMIARIAALSEAFIPYQIWNDENRSFELLSSERAMLLLALVHTPMDSAAFQMIKRNVRFSGADLRSADLHGLNLSGIDLKYANLQYANLQDIKLDNADLRGANMTGVNLNQASLSEVNLIATTLTGAKINGANMQSARLDSADLSHATLVKSRLHSATFIHTILNNAILYEADVTNGFLFGTFMSNANFSKAVLQKATITNAHMNGTLLADAIADADLWKMIKEKNTDGAHEILTQYRIIPDSTTIKDSLYYKIMIVPQ